MKKYLIVCVIMVLSNNLCSQPYKIIRPELTIFYKQGSSNIYTIRIDSVRFFNNDTIYYNMRNLRSVNGSTTLFSILYDQFSGKKIIETDSGYTYFVKSSMDTLWLNQSALSNESWIFYKNNTDSSYIEATIDSIVNTHLIDTLISDSVKIISFKKKDKNGVLINSNINSKQIWLTKNYGLCKIILFDLINFSSSQILEFDLCGISELNLGYKNTTLKDIYNFSIGDIFHIEKINTFNSSNENIRTCLEVISKSTLVNSFSYQYKRKEKENSVINNDIITATYQFNDVNYSFLNYLPGEVKVNSNKEYFAAIPCIFNNHFGKMFRTVYRQTDTSTIYFTLKWEYGWFMSSRAFYEGLGGEFHYDEVFVYPAPDVDSRTLKYYLKGSEEYGAPYNCDALVALPPSIITQTATNITSTSATLKGSVKPLTNNSYDQVTFNYGLTNIYGDSANATPYTIIGTTNIDVSCNLINLIPNTTYHFQVIATNLAFDTIRYGNDLIFTTIANSFDDNGNENLKIEVTPNPFNDELLLVVKFPFLQNIIVKVYSITNELVYENFKNRCINEYKNKINMSKCSKGIYFIIIITQDKVYSKKIIKQ